MSSIQTLASKIYTADADTQTARTDDSLAGVPREAAWVTTFRRETPPVDIRSLDGVTRLLKRTVDIVVAVSLLVLLSPLMLLVAALVRLTSPGPAIFRQQRVGLNLRRCDRRQHGLVVSAPATRCGRRARDDRRRQVCYGKPFVLYKFRTMRIDAEKHGPRFASHGDQRVTPLGRLLRKTRIDELPQLWNVLKGEMSLVGPRPERPEFIAELSREIPGYRKRLGLKPGLTGIAQVINGYDNNIESFRRKVAFDLLYLRNCCLRNDLKILVRTVGVVLTGKGAL